LLGEIHHPVVVLVGDINLHGGELWVVCPVHAFVTEVLGKLVHAFKTAYDEALQVELIGNAQVEGNVQGIVVGDEGAGGRSTGYGLKNGGLHFHVASFVEEVAHGAEHQGAFAENVFDLIVDNQVDVALTVAEFGVGKGIEHFAVFFLDHRQGAQGFGQYGKFLCVDGYFTHLGTEHVAFDANKVADVQEFLEHGVVQFFVFSGADGIPGQVDLNAAI